MSEIDKTKLTDDTPRSSVRFKVVAGLAIVMLVFTGLTVYSIVLHRRTISDLGLINSSYLPLTIGVSKIRSTQTVFNTLLDRLADDPNQSVTREWIDAARRFRPSTLDKLKQITDEALRHDIPNKEASFVTEMNTRIIQVEKRYNTNESKFIELYALMDTGHIDEARIHIEGLKRDERFLDRVLAGIGEEVGRHITALAEDAESSGTSANLGLAFLTLAGLIVAAAVVISTNRLLVPLKTLRDAVAKVAKGDLGVHIKVARHDEIGALARGFNNMTESLAERDQMLIRSERLATTGKMAAQVTHEIRNPLSSLGLNAELLEEELSEEMDEAKDLLGAIQDEIGRLTGITESYLRFARLPTPEPDFDDLNATVESAIDFMRTEINESDIEIKTKLSNNLAALLFDKNQIRQALANLIRNASEAMTDGGTLEVKTILQGENVELSISDTGPGIPSDAREQIFDSFYTTKSGGTGLGLPLVRQICLAHGGNIRCESNDNHGSIFTISLPCTSDKKKEPSDG